jgi:hypothetical protein
MRSERLRIRPDDQSELTTVGTGTTRKVLKSAAVDEREWIGVRRRENGFESGCV